MHCFKMEYANLCQAVMWIFLGKFNLFQIWYNTLSVLFLGYILRGDLPVWRDLHIPLSFLVLAPRSPKIRLIASSFILQKQAFSLPIYFPAPTNCPCASEDGLNTRDADYWPHYLYQKGNGSTIIFPHYVWSPAAHAGVGIELIQDSLKIRKEF